MGRRTRLRGEPISDRQRPKVMRPLRSITLLVVVLAVAGCAQRSEAPSSASNAAPSVSPTMPVGSPSSPSIPAAGSRDGGGSGAAGFAVDGAFYTLSCAGVDPESLRTEVGLFRVNSENEERMVREVAGGAGRELLAVRVTTEGCGNEGDGRSDWSMGFDTRPETRAKSEALACEVGLMGPGQRAVSGCAARP